MALAVRILFLTALVSVALTGRAFAQAPACADLFSRAQTRTSTASLTDLSRTLVLNQKNVDAFESQIEAYLKQEGLEFRKLPAKNEGHLGGVVSHGYLLTGRRDGGATSRLLYGLQLKKSEAPNVVLDSLYELREVSAAHYTIRDHMITVGISALELRAKGEADFLRHEVQHHLEQIKIEKGEFSLARFIFENSKGEANADYDARLSFDELESYLRDLRFFKNRPSPRAEATRAQLLKLIEKEKALLARLRERLENPSPEEANQMWASTFGKGETPMNGFYEFKLGETETVVLRVSFLQTMPRRPRPNQLDFLIEQTIGDAEFRISEIEREIGSALAKRPRAD